MRISWLDLSVLAVFCVVMSAGVPADMKITQSTLAAMDDSLGNCPVEGRQFNMLPRAEVTKIECNGKTAYMLDRYFIAGTTVTCGPGRTVIAAWDPPAVPAGIGWYSVPWWCEGSPIVAGVEIVLDPLATSVEITGIPEGVCHFSISVVDSLGVRSVVTDPTTIN